MSRAGRRGIPSEGRVFVVSGPSGGGKTTVVHRLLASIPWMRRSVSVTTRPKRLDEHPGRDYRFVSQAWFDRMRRSGQLLEWATVHGASYGTPKRPVLQALARGHDVVLSIDVQGARQVRRLLGKRCVLVFLLPPSMAVLKRRLRKRRTETEAAIQQRLAAAQRELAQMSRYDYAVVNDQLEQAVGYLWAIVIAHRCRADRLSTIPWIRRETRR